MEYRAIACIADKTKKAQSAYKLISKNFKCIKNPAKADVIIVLGGDGFMLHCIHKYMDLNIPFYGVNCGTVGFLMNEYKSKLLDSLKHAKTELIKPLRMVARTTDGKKHPALAVNEVSLLRSSKQTAKLRISINNKIRVEELICDGALVATPAGSTAYNLSVHGPIVPLGSGVLALTPISPFRPRRWRGALLSHKAVIKIDIIGHDKRPVNAVADFTEVKNIVSVEIREESDKEIKLLFDPGHSLEERIILEQFVP